MVGAPWRSVVGQLVGVWVAATVGLFLAGHVALFAWLFQVRSGVVPALIALGMLAVALLCAGSLCWRGSTLTTTTRGKLAWTAAVTLLGIPVAVFVGAVTEALEPGVDLDFTGFMAVSAAFALVAGLMVNRVAARWACGCVLGAAVVVGLWLPTAAQTCAEDVADEPTSWLSPNPPACDRDVWRHFREFWSDLVD
ncbi:hypothetical protein SAMN05192558_101202 [Actinokineospora alba]|uniref:Uncharacterized protein n=1 Tax=Actinokineospora alba TaxID=504798 RepID=A0A1H0F2I7_9PSEU|nr:hypothetical protein C8E96_4898 [Actinokineospora alba]SDI19543.1 hypothetical protein SAMN05421871_103668 [Actinokineospora alba]SDN88773.1 hypothetical protein SAMN05192558_101202 [Actinokineospora alba]